MPRAILFDAVGTLIHADPPVEEAYFRVGCELESAVSLAEIRERFRAAYARSESLFALPGGDELARQGTSDARERQRWRQVIGEVFADLPAAAADESLERLWRHFASPAHWRLFDDVFDVWNTLESRGCVLGIASNFDSRLRGILQGLPPLDRCQHVFISSEIGYPKPSERFFEAVEERLILPPGELLLVGDDYTNDVVGAQRRGWQTRWLCRQPDRPAGAIGSLRELLGRNHEIH